MLEEARPMLEKLGMTSGYKHSTGGCFEFFYELSSTLLHLPPLRFHCVGGCWDRNRTVANLALVVRRSNH
jgi:hypothetical protein